MADVSSPEAARKLVEEGARFLSQGDANAAENYWRGAVQLDAECIAAWNHLTDLLTTSQRLQEANDCLIRLTSLAQKTPRNLIALGEKSWLLQQYDLSRKFLRDAVLLDPLQASSVPVCLLRAKLEFLAENYEAAVQEANQVLQTEPHNQVALKIRQQCWRIIGDAARDVADSRTLNQICPDPRDHADVIFNSLFLSTSTPELIYEEASRWNTLYAEPLLTKALPHKNVPDPNRRLRIGYVSPDFKDHAIMKLLPAVFEHTDRSQFEVMAYSIETKSDLATLYVRKNIDHFIELPADPQTIAKRIHQDGVDILVDLAGHSMPANALLAFVLKPAPVQVNWMGVHSTTGLKTIDYFLGDQDMPAPGTEHLFSEHVFRLPQVQYAYRATDKIDVAPAPSIANGFITFGCFNNPKKITRAVAKVWALILHLHPQSKLLLKYRGLERPSTQRRICDWLIDDGIGTNRLLFEGADQSSKYLESYSRIDIALDPFPYNGGTTTLDTLYMGVPLVSLRGRLAVNCCGASFLSAVGLPVADTAEQYIAHANHYVQAIATSPSLRWRIRDAMSKSALMDEQGLASALAAAYRKMCTTWCQTQGAA